jgi:hypothetical protein
MSLPFTESVVQNVVLRCGNGGSWLPPQEVCVSASAKFMEAQK